jgi:histidinol dehydrogenase
MKVILYPDESAWESLCVRPEMVRKDLGNTVREILNDVKAEKDKALYYYSGLFDGVSPGNLKVSAEEIKSAIGQVPGDLKKAINAAKSNIEKFHLAQMIPEQPVETSSGVMCWRKNVPIEKVGLYIPGGSAPLFSTLLMLGVPAKLAGCGQIVVCTPAGKDGTISPIILYTAGLLGITDIYKTGGAQAIAAMAYGTETIPRVYKIFGPGNQYVTRAKEMVQQDGVAIDMPAGPSEVLVIADGAADPEFVAADLLSQAEHGADSQVIMVTDSRDLIEKVRSAVERQTELLPRKETAMKSLVNSKLILLNSPDECIRFSNTYAPEHLILNTLQPNTLAEKVINAGSVFLGKYSGESMGDYASGTNHTLPTNGFARNYGGLSSESFLRKITFQEISAEGLKLLGPSVELIAGAESLDGHRNAVSIRLKEIDNG